MYCPNCGGPNPDGAKFCAHCGTHFDVAAIVPPLPPVSVPPARATTRDAFLKNLAIGCLIFVGIVLFVGLSCARSCFFGRRLRRFRR